MYLFGGAIHLYLVLIILLCTILLLVASQHQEEVFLNYQIMQYDGENITIGVLYSGSCTSLRAEVFPRSAIFNSDFHSPAGVYLSTSSKIVIPSQALSQKEDMLVHLVALNGSRICSDDSSPDNFYHFSPNGMSMTNMPMDEMGEVRIPLPNPSICRSTPTFLWPKNMGEDEESCYCLPIENDDYSFVECMQNCETNYDIQLLDRSVAFRNLNETDRFLVHFVCDEDPCTGRSCFMETFMDSYAINSLEQSASAQQSMGVCQLSLSLLAYTVFVQHR